MTPGTSTREVPQVLDSFPPDNICSLGREIGDGDLIPGSDVHLSSDSDHSGGGDEEPAVADAGVGEEGEGGENPPAGAGGHVGSVGYVDTDTSIQFLGRHSAVELLSQELNNWTFPLGLELVPRKRYFMWQFLYSLEFIPRFNIFSMIH